MAAAPPKVIHIVADYTAHYGRDVVAGAMHYIRLHVPWLTRIWAVGGVLELLNIPCDGMVAMLWNDKVAATLKERGVPTVNTSGGLRESPVPRVMVDDCAVGAMAADHLLDCGLERFVFVGPERPASSQDRLKGYRERLREHGRDCDVLAAPGGGSPEDSFRANCDLVRQMPKPAGVLAYNDRIGDYLVFAAEWLGVAVPDDMAVLGVDNDSFRQTWMKTPLSSIPVPAQQIGWQAAKLLDRIIAGEGDVPRQTLLPPQQVISRASTDFVAFGDPAVRQAVRFIRAHLQEPFTIAQVAKAANVSRRTLETRFRNQLGRSINQVIIQRRVERAKSLLEQTDLPVKSVAVRAGVSTAEYLCDLFRKHVHTSPQQYRLQFRGSAEAE
jgi:LacI family transcriptional regulator